MSIAEKTNVSSESVLALVDKLCQNLTRLHVSASISEFSDVRKDFTKKSKLRLWDNLILKRNVCPRAEAREGRDDLYGANKILFHTYTLLKSNETKRARRIQELVEKYVSLEKNHNPILELIAMLRRSHGPADGLDREELQDAIKNLNLYENFILNKTDLPIDVLDDETYGSEDGTCHQAPTWKIPAYDEKSCADCFNVEKVLKNAKSDGQKKMADFFNINADTLTSNQYANLNKETLFTALVSKRVREDHGVNLTLDIPDLPDDVNLFKWQIPTTQTYDWVDYQSSRFNDLKNMNPESDSKTPDDEGFISNKSSPVSISGKSMDSGFCQKSDNMNEIWENSVKNFKSTNYIDWDMRDKKEALYIQPIGETPCQNEKCLLIDSSAHVFDQFYYHYLNTVNTITDEISSDVDRLLISEKQFIIDCLNLLLSLPSKSFALIYNEFVFNYRAHVTGMSAESLASYSRHFIQTGTFHRFLLDLTSIPLKSPDCGAVFRSFVSGIKSFLDRYHTQVLECLKDSKSFTIISLYNRFKPYIDQIRFLVTLCNFNNEKLNAISNPRILAYNLKYPRGIDLIIYLYKMAKLNINNQQNYPLVLHLFVKSIRPFLMFIEQWIFHGHYFDPFDEFIIEMSHDQLNSRDKTNQFRSYKLKDRFSEKSGESEDRKFLFQYLYEDVLNCGKSLALLRVCEPKHFLCNNRKFYPRLVVDCNSRSLKQVDIICRDYLAFVVDKAKDKLKPRKQLIEEKQKLKLEMQLKMQAEAADRFERFQEQIIEERRLINEKKKQALEFLKEQMEADLKRREDVKTQQKLEDKAYMQSVINRDFELNQKQKELEKQLKKEMIDEYEELGKQAEAREEAARRRIAEAKQKLEGNEAGAEAAESAKLVDVSDLDIEMMDTDEAPPAANPQSSILDTFDRLMQNENQSATTAEQPKQAELSVNQDEAMDVDMADPSPIKPNTAPVELLSIPDPPRANEGVQSAKTAIKLFQDKHHSVESNNDKLVQEYHKKIENFKARNTFGHSSDSTMQDLLYNANYLDSDSMLSNRKKGQVVDDADKSAEESASFVSRMKKSQSKNRMMIINEDSQVDIDERNQMKKFLKFTQKDTRVESINFDEIIQPYETYFDFNGDVYRSLLTSREHSFVRSNLNEVESLIEKNMEENVHDMDFFEDDNSSLKQMTFINEIDLDEAEILIENEYWNGEAEANVSDRAKSLYSYSYIDLEELLNRVAFRPIHIQNEIVNKCLVNHFLVDLNLEEHLNALRKYLLFEDGEFAQTFVDNMCINLFEADTSRKQNSIFKTDMTTSVVNLNDYFLSPIYINEALNKAISAVKNNKYAENLSIRINEYANNEQLISTMSMSILGGMTITTSSLIEPDYRTSALNDCYLLNFLSSLELRYRITWPLNMVVTEACMKNYNQIFGFLLQIKFVISCLNSIWHHLKRTEMFFLSCIQALINNCSESIQLKELKLISHEMQHYISALQNYIYNQVIQVAWQDLQKNLNDIKSLDDLIQVHARYIRIALSKCFFTKKAEVIRKEIQTIFQLILGFRSQLFSESFKLNEETNQHEHSLYETMIKTYDEFRSHSLFVFKVLKKLVSNGFEFHLNNLALTLNFNFYYAKDASAN